MGGSSSDWGRSPASIGCVAASVLALALAACGGGGPNLPSLATGGGLTAVGASAGGGAVATLDNSPFQDVNGAALQTREVIANPTLDQVMQAAGPLPEMSLGRADAPVTVIKYASMTCPYCRQFQVEGFAQLKRDYIDTGKVRFILREFPIGFQSGLATIAKRCVPENRYFQAYDKLMRHQNAWVSMETRAEPIVKVMGEFGLTADKLESCRQDKALVGALDAVKQRGRLLGIVGTPNYFINGRLIKHTLTWNDMKAVIDPLLAGPPALAQKT